jgi:hypothetical protein
MNDINKNDDPIEAIHPVYGKFMYNQWIPLKGFNNTIKEIHNLDPYEIYIQDDILDPYLIRNTTSNKNNKLSKCREKVSLFINGKKIDYMIYQLILSSTFPDINLPECKQISVDHINYKYIDNRVINLEWLDLKKNCRKGQKKSVENIKLQGGKNGKPIIMFVVNLKSKTKDDKWIEFKKFRSIESTAKYIIENNMGTQGTNQHQTARKIGEIVSGKRQTYNNRQYTFKAVEYTEIDGEEWKPIPKDLYQESKETYYVSNYGRIKGIYDIIMRPHLQRCGSKYSSVFIHSRRYYIHCLMWITFNGIYDMKKMDIAHDDKAPLYKDPKTERIYYRNYLEDLRLKSRTDNMREFHTERKNQKIIIEPRPNYEYNEEDYNEEFVQTITSESKQKKEDVQQMDKDSLKYLMINRPNYVQFKKGKSDNYSGYVLSRRLTKKSDITTTCSSLFNLKIKFMEVMYVYNQYPHENMINFDLDKIAEEELTDHEQTQLTKLLKKYDKNQ